ncbi:MAG: response regulator [Deltaproteobacteria bacterium]|nr:response regulator [Deltaproteobacteria bacterium]
MKKQELVDKMVGISKSSPPEMRMVFDGCLELQRMYKKVLEIDEDLGPVDAEAKLTEIINLRQRLISQIELGSYAAGTVHDFSNILGSIIGYATMAYEDCPEDSVVRKHMKQVLQACSLATDLVKQMKIFSRKSSRSYTRFPLRSVIFETIEQVDAEKPEQIEVSHDIKLQKQMMFADPTQIRQVLAHVFNNAVQAMEPQGGVLQVTADSVEVTLEEKESYPELDQGPYICITVSDTGPGIDPAIRDTIFDPFVTTKTSGHCEGIGLSVARGVVRSIGGGIAVGGEPGEGAIVNIYLPEVFAETQGLADRRNPLLEGDERILLVDDDELLLNLERKMLESMGYEVTTARSSLEALRVFSSEQHAFDLVITDHTMPHMTGYELAIKLMEVRADIPIVLCTGYVEHVSLEKAREAGIVEFIVKPVDRRLLALTIRKVIGNKGRPSQAL